MRNLVQFSLTEAGLESERSWRRQGGSGVGDGLVQCRFVDSTKAWCEHVARTAGGKSAIGAAAVFVDCSSRACVPCALKWWWLRRDDLARDRDL